MSRWGAAAFLLASPLCIASPSLHVAIDVLKRGNFQSIDHVAALPAAVVRLVDPTAQLSDPHGPFNATDIGAGPRERLLWAASDGANFVVATERGGRGYSRSVLVTSFDPVGGSAQVLWEGTVDGVSTVPELLVALENLYSGLVDATACGFEMNFAQSRDRYLIATVEHTGDASCSAAAVCYEIFRVVRTFAYQDPGSTAPPSTIRVAVIGGSARRDAVGNAFNSKGRKSIGTFLPYPAQSELYMAASTSEPVEPETEDIYEKALKLAKAAPAMPSGATPAVAFQAQMESAECKRALNLYKRAPGASGN
jgi:hypothetical protein